MKQLFIAVILVYPMLVFAQSASRDAAPVSPVKYAWTEPVQKKPTGVAYTNIFTGSAHEFAYMAMDACRLNPEKKADKRSVPVDEEYLIMIKSGSLKVSFADSTWTLGPGSVALLMPGEKFSLQTTGTTPSRFYLMKYRSKEGVDMARGKEAGGSFVKDWNKLKFRSHDRGGVRSYFQQPTAMSKRFEMHVTTLKPNLKSHEPHTHKAEEIILMLDDGPGGKAQTEMLVGDQSFRGGAGDLYYVGTNLLHGIKNIGEVECSYFAFQFE